MIGPGNDKCGYCHHPRWSHLELDGRACSLCVLCRGFVESGAPVIDRAAIYQLERDSIRQFVASHHFQGSVLDYGCGKQPYRDIVEEDGAEYVPWDRATFPGGTGGDIGGVLGKHDVVLCTQVIQYADDPYSFLVNLRMHAPTLVLTGPGCWHEEEPESLWRFTRAGIRRLLEEAGFTVERLEDRGTVDLGGFPISVGWGAVARA